MAQLAANPVFADDEWHDISRGQVRERTVKRVREAYKLLVTDGSDVTRRNCRSDLSRCSLHLQAISLTHACCVPPCQAGDPLAARPGVVRASGRALRALHGCAGGPGLRRPAR